MATLWTLSPCAISRRTFFGLRDGTVNETDLGSSCRRIFVLVSTDFTLRFAVRGRTAGYVLVHRTGSMVVGSLHALRFSHMLRRHLCQRYATPPLPLATHEQLFASPFIGATAASASAAAL